MTMSRKAPPHKKRHSTLQLKSVERSWPPQQPNLANFFKLIDVPTQPMSVILLMSLLHRRIEARVYINITLVIMPKTLWADIHMGLVEVRSEALSVLLDTDYYYFLLKLNTNIFHLDIPFTAADSLLRVDTKNLGRQVWCSASEYFI